ncbi:unnamed protein product [Dovyalis caffra]|uniref:Uncharacterized protein n=1 Tax=Dovyalis caffra TaxID=77055 RepID=A0AAV1QTJ6_9ROSI|nr:unnamed protein product [Dovyalis caffra]
MFSPPPFGLSLESEPLCVASSRKAFQLQRQVSRVRKEFDCWDRILFEALHHE